MTYVWIILVELIGIAIGAFVYVTLLDREALRRARRGTPLYVAPLPMARVAVVAAYRRDPKAWPPC